MRLLPCVACMIVLLPMPARCHIPDPTVAGPTTQFTLSSEILGEEREIVVALPDDYDRSDARYPVLYVLDARWHLLPALTATRMLAETSYIRSHRIPKLLLIGIDSVDRNREDTPTNCVEQHGMRFPTSGGADAFLTFIGDELIPAVDARFRTQPHRILSGWSLGGLLTMHALLERPDLFDGYIAISPSLWWQERRLVDRAADLAGRGEPRDRDLVVTIGAEEEGGLCYEAVHDLLRRWESAPVPKLRFHLVEIPGEDHNHTTYKAYFDGLRTLFADWFFPEAAFADGLASIEAFYEAASERYGYDIPVPDHVFDALSRSLLAEGRFAEAVGLAETRCAQEPASVPRRFELGETRQRAGDVDGACLAYREAIELEMRANEPDSVFIRYVEQQLAVLESSD